MSITGEGFFDKLREIRLDKIVSEHGNTKREHATRKRLSRRAFVPGYALTL